MSVIVFILGILSEYFYIFAAENKRVHSNLYLDILAGMYIFQTHKIVITSSHLRSMLAVLIRNAIDLLYQSYRCSQQYQRIIPCSDKHPFLGLPDMHHFMHE